MMRMHSLLKLDIILEQDGQVNSMQETLRNIER